MSPHNDKRILVVFPGALGDFICLLPALERLAKYSSIDVLARSEFAALTPAGITVGSLERLEIRSLFIPEGSGDNTVSSFFRHYSHTLSWMGSGQPTFVEELLSVTRGKARVFPFRPLRPSMHQVDYYLSCLGSTGGVCRPRVIPKPENLAKTEEYWKQNALDGGPVLAIAPGSGAREKNWPSESFAAVARWWRQRVGGIVMIILGPAEEERGESNFLWRDSLLVRGTDLGRVAALLARCSLFVGNDSGVSHLAAAVGTPTVAVFGPSDSAQWAPRGPRVLILARNVECSPCTLPTMKTCAHRKCLTAFGAPEVIRELEAFPAIATLTRARAGITVACEVSPESTRRIDAKITHQANAHAVNDPK